MSSVEQVRKLAAEGKPASVIAEELGISRQRVYQIAAAEEIPLPRYHQQHVRSPIKPKARILTGGVPQQVNASVAGTIAELLVAADLMARGWCVFMPIIASKGHDLIATQDGTLITVEVRSAYRNAAGSLIYGRKPDCKSSHYGLVVTGEPVAYEPDLP